MKKDDWWCAVLINIIALFLVLDLFLHKGQPASFDETIHITNIAQFYRGLSEGEFPVAWADGFANYGMPIPLIAQQTTSYLGAFINFFTNDVVLSYNVVVLIGALFSTLFFYFFLRIYLDPQRALLGAFLFNFTSYRIINIYIRGSIPEFFASIFLPLLLIGIYLVVKKQKLYGLLFITVSVSGIILTHPFTLLIYAFVFIPYLIFCLWPEKKRFKLLWLIFVAIGLGIGTTAYYVLPLFVEIKYFFYGLTNNHLVPNQYLHLNNYLDPNWYYYYKGDTFTRGHFIKFDLLETIIVIIGSLYYLWNIIHINAQFKILNNGLPTLRKTLLFELVEKFSMRANRPHSKNKMHNMNELIATAVVASPIIVLLTSQLAAPLYEHFNFLSTIQHPWRMLSVLIFLPPIFLVYLIPEKFKQFTIILFIFVICVLRFPQLYGKNYSLYPQEYYFFTIENLHGTILNTVWTSNTADYPVKKHRAEIIEGKGMIKERVVKNSLRSYTVNAKTDIRMVDYTFYYPGWMVYVDGKKSEIEFQDPNYRGVITYRVPKGDHAINVQFEDTKVRRVSKYISILSVLLSLCLFSFIKKSNTLKEIKN